MTKCRHGLSEDCPACMQATIDALVKALEGCRTSYCGYAITDPAQYPEVLAGFWKELSRIDHVARRALASVSAPGESS